MEQKSGFFCTIYVDEDEIYSGDLSEIPEKFRHRIIGDIAEWAESLGKGGINELLYSHLVWYERKADYCEECDKWYEDLGTKICETCGAKLKEDYLYERNPKLDKIMVCIGMISRIQVS
ncbi:MAG: hypothetical protein O6849_03255 [Candidatus Dadabacteria bacterium]|nr:hypothetical protein [Candidatus Dadabacteria bacterium]MCZ6864743.1 hypothetical protein [Candidatus Dadabacteria bacterium]